VSKRKPSEAGQAKVQMILATLRPATAEEIAREKERRALYARG
jgi:hypothetical protein